jgi:hypothetical protein
MTDKEKRIFLAAIERERKICKAEDNYTPDGVKLVPVCDSIRWKIMHSELWEDEEEIPWN